MYSFLARTEGLPMPCLGFGLSARGFWNGKVTGTSVTSYLTLKCPSVESSWEQEKSTDKAISSEVGRILKNWIVKNQRRESFIDGLISHIMLWFQKVVKGDRLIV